MKLVIGRTIVLSLALAAGAACSQEARQAPAVAPVATEDAGAALREDARVTPHAGRYREIVREEPAHCPELEVEVRAAIDALPRRCTADADCVATGFGCPFGCAVAVSKAADLTLIEQRVARYQAECDGCLYACGDVVARCVSGRCELTEPDPR